ncbi:MAG: winged helix DNA-binding domain-containing protein [Porphyromonadaceae bacterium]|nr:winged helix DNA-binding domain-containing protein [Porphyromonadaceae bacterium]
MNHDELLYIRLYNQLLTLHELKEPREVVARMGAIQSQALDMAKWAIGSRLQGHTAKSITDALNRGEVIRTHILRPTWHFVAAEDLWWMYSLSYPRLKPVYRSYAKMLGADESLLYPHIPLIEVLLSGGRHLTKQEIGNALAERKVILDDNHLSLLLSFAELEGIIVNGELDGNRQTFTLMEEWVPRIRDISREEALERLARRYFTSHGPATLQDFNWWSGLSVTECRQAMEMIRPHFIRETVNEKEYWMPDDIRTPSSNQDSALLLAPFDEFVVSYKDRSGIIEETHYSKVITRNGIFSPTIMLNGTTIGSWKKSMKKNVPRITLTFFGNVPKNTIRLFQPEVARLEQFYA